MDLAQKTNEQSTDLVSAHAEFQSHLPYMGLSRGSLTMQQEKFIQLIVSGMTIAAAGRGAGYASRSSAYEAHKAPSVQQAIEYYREWLAKMTKTRQNDNRGEIPAFSRYRRYYRETV